MLRFPVNLTETDARAWVASWVDFPHLDAVTADTAQGAFELLIDRTYEAVSDLIAKGQHPEPSAQRDRPVVSFSIPGSLVPPHLARLLSVTKLGSAMLTYSWTNDYAYVG
jgi:hypothetical protein